MDCAMLLTHDGNSRAMSNFLYASALTPHPPLSLAREGETEGSGATKSPSSPFRWAIARERGSPEARKNHSAGRGESINAPKVREI
jgi:hypothetical protein